MKICSRCGKEKTLDRFYRRNEAKSGYRSECKRCTDLRTKDYIERNPAKVIDRKARHRDCNRESLAAKRRQTYLINRDRELSKAKEYNQRNRSHIQKREQDIRDAVSAVATRNNQRWSVAEDGIVMQQDLTEKEKAFILHRTLPSVKYRMGLLRKVAQA